VYLARNEQDAGDFGAPQGYRVCRLALEFSWNVLDFILIMPEMEIIPGNENADSSLRSG
jgi:hypothetical protein